MPTAAPPLARKLGVGPGGTVALIDAPAGWSIADLPAGATVRRRAPSARTPVDVAILFCTGRAGLHRRIPGLEAGIPAAGSLWVAWPRRAGGHTSDLTDVVVRDELLPLGLVDVKVAALDDDWSGLRFVWRKELRATRPL